MFASDFLQAGASLGSVGTIFKLLLLLLHGFFLANLFFALSRVRSAFVWSFCDIVLSLMPTTSLSRSISSLSPA